MLSPYASPHTDEGTAERSAAISVMLFPNRSGSAHAGGYSLLDAPR